MQSGNSQNSHAQQSLIKFLENGIAVLQLGSSDERVVTLTEERLVSIRDNIAQLKKQKPIGLIISGPNRDMFTAGADINLIREVKSAELGEKLAAEGQALFDEIEKLPFPTVATISGPCVGGGCEMVLACKHRIITEEKSSSIGLPEIKLGILPGFGGTQRMPRLIGITKALDIILAGKILKPKQALKYGLVDQIVPFGSLQEAATKLIVSGNKIRKLPFLENILTYNSFLQNFVKNKAAKTIAKQTKGFYPAPPLALECVIYGLKNGMAEGLKFEAKKLGELIVTPESKSLVNVFFLSEAAKGLGKSGRKAVENISSLVIGAGTMGAGIAAVLARCGSAVTLKDTSAEALRRGLEQIKKYISGLKNLNETEKSVIIHKVETTTKDSQNLQNANLVIEAVFEDISLKKKILVEAAEQVKDDAIIASNTSSLSVTEIAAAIKNPERVVGMHFFNPVEKMPLVEIIRGKQSSDKSILVVAALATKVGKFPIIVEDVPGFLINRILTPYLNEAVYLLAEGYKIADIDKAATNFGMPMGPIRLLDEVGLDVAAHVAEVMLKGYGERMATPEFAKALVTLGRKGKKTNAGFYDFIGEEAFPAYKIKEYLKLSSEDKSNPDLNYISKRLIYSLINEAVKCLDEGVAGTPGREAANQVDLGTVMGIGFPPFRGGLLNYANSLGAKELLTAITAFEKEFGKRFEVASGIKIRANKNLDFYQAAQ